MEGEKSATFNAEQGVALGCSLSPLLFSIFVNDITAVEQADLRDTMPECVRGSVLHAILLLYSNTAPIYYLVFYKTISPPVNSVIPL